MYGTCDRGIGAMKLTLCALLAMTGLSMAGTTTYVEPAPAPAPAEPNLWRWFVGGSAGYFFDQYEEEYYTAHIGVETPMSPGGWNTSIFLEGLYTNPEDHFDYYRGQGDEFFLSRIEVDLEIIPVTLNVKFEKEFTNHLTLFAGGGLGVAFVDLTLKDREFGGRASSDDTVFAAQAFAGLGYNFTPNFGMYAQARWLYLDDAHDFDLQDDFGAELGLRFKF